MLHALLGDTTGAWRVADRLAIPSHRAVAFTAVAGYLARVPVRVTAFRNPVDADPLIHTIRALALAASPQTPGDDRAAARFVRQALEGDGWHHALPVLARIAPEAVVRVRDISLTHLRNGARPSTPPPGASGSAPPGVV
ncbi:hypothetical protein [Streptomyces sp. NBC_00454]|uniref:hypothetical protein n=1 Tax=Streptomyces sp. NBC_00454 TaxID=2975747 RepID=UPI00324D0BAA